MLAFQCLFCDHDNPVAAKYCMECGSQLNLRLCKQCEAINDRTAQSCHNCGMAFAAPPVAEQSRTAEPVTEAVPLSIPSLRKRPGKGSQTWRSLLSLVFALMLGGFAYFFYRPPSLAPSRIEPVQSAPAEASAGDAAAHLVVVSPSGGAVADGAVADGAVADGSMGNSTTPPPAAEAATPQPVTQTKRSVTRAPSSYGKRAAAMTRGPTGHNRVSAEATDAPTSDSAISGSSASKPPVLEAPTSDSAVSASSTSKQPALNNDYHFNDHHFIAPPP